MTSDLFPNPTTGERCTSIWLIIFLEQKKGKWNRNYALLLKLHSTMCICSVVTRSRPLQIRDACSVNSKNYNWTTAAKKGGGKTSLLYYLPQQFPLMNELKVLLRNGISKVPASLTDNVLLSVSVKIYETFLSVQIQNSFNVRLGL